MLQVRNLPDDVHAKLKARAAEERMSLSDFVARELARLVDYRSNAEIISDFHRRNPDWNVTSDEILGTLRADRDERA